MSITNLNDWTVTDLAARFGPIAHGRIRQKPPPGSAAAQDVITIHQKEKRLYELKDAIAGWIEAAEELGKAIPDDVESARVEVGG